MTIGISIVPPLWGGMFFLIKTQNNFSIAHKYKRKKANIFITKSKKAKCNWIPGCPACLQILKKSKSSSYMPKPCFLPLSSC